MTRQQRKKDLLGAGVFALLSLLFILSAWAVPAFFDWIFARHQNRMSWYIRPLFLIPFCYAAYRRSLTGIGATLFALLSSMCWFPQPAQVSPEVQAFLAFEQEWLRADWTWAKCLQALTVPLSLFLLALAFWKRSVRLGLGLMVLMAGGKILWSVYQTGTAGLSILLPAVIGLLLCLILVYWLFRKRKPRAGTPKK